MTAAITSFWTASALGVGNAETLANLQRGTAPGMREIGGDIPGRTIFFGGIDVALPLRESLARTRRRHDEHCRSYEEQPRREVGRARAPASSLGRQPKHRRELDARAASPAEHAPCRRRKRQRQEET